jgi:hypothetical protein
VTTFRNILFCFILITVTAPKTDAQGRSKLDPMNGVYGELFLITPDMDYAKPAINYERVFTSKGTLSGRMGVILPDFRSKILIIPITVQGYTTGGKQHHLEYGGGVMPSIDYGTDKLKYTFYPALMAGYRFQRGSGLMFRATANIIIPKFYLNPSISIGYLF